MAAAFAEPIETDDLISVGAPFVALLYSIDTVTGFRSLAIGPQTRTATTRAEVTIW